MRLTTIFLVASTCTRQTKAKRLHLQFKKSVLSVKNKYCFRGVLFCQKLGKRGSETQSPREGA